MPLKFYLTIYFEYINSDLVMISMIFFLFVSVTFSYNIPTFTQQNNISVPITLNGYDECRFFKIQNSKLYRMGQSNLISRWDLNTFAYVQQGLYQTANWSENVFNIAIGQNNDDQIAVTIITAPPNKKFDVINPTTLIKTITFANTTSVTYTISKVQTTSTQYMQLVYSNSVSNYLNIYNKSMIMTYQINLGFRGVMNSTMSEDQSALVIWNYQGKIKYVEKVLSIWTCVSSYTPSTNIQAMNDVALSKNGTFAILQYDSLSPLIVYNFRTNTTVSSKVFSNTIINQAIFLDNDCHLIALTINYTTLQIYDSFTMTLQSSRIFNYLSNYSAIDYSKGKLYFCIQQNIQTYKIYCPYLTYRSPITFQCIQCNLSSDCNGCDSDTGVCNSCLTNFTLNASTFVCQIVSNAFNDTNTTNSTNTNFSQVLNNTNYTSGNSSYFNQTTNSTNTNFSQVLNNTNQTSGNSSYFNQTTNSTNKNFSQVLNNTNNTSGNSSYFNPNLGKQIKTISNFQASIANTTLNSFDYLSPAITTIFAILQISPFTFIFLSFMNYWNLCCLYSILNIKVPEYMLRIHQKILQAIQESIFQKLGFNPIAPSLNNQRISSEYFSIDYGISLDIINPNVQNVLMIAFVVALILAITYLRNFLLKKSQLLYNLLKFNIVQSILGQFISFVPFCILPFRFLLASSIQNFTLKANLILQILLLLICFSIPSIFIWSRSQLYMQHKIKKRMSLNKTRVKILINKIKSKDKKIQKQNIKELQMLLVNISIPFLIILPNYLPFFMVNLFILFWGVKRALFSTQYRINSIISACYLPLYHICYIIFYLFEQNDFICHYVGLFCLVLLFVGGIHELCNVIILSMINFVIWCIKTIKLSYKSQQNQSLNFKTEEKSNQNIIRSIFRKDQIINGKMIKQDINFFKIDQQSTLREVKKAKQKIIVNNIVHPFPHKEYMFKQQDFQPIFKRYKLKIQKDSREIQHNKNKSEHTQQNVKNTNNKENLKNNEKNQTQTLFQPIRRKKRNVCLYEQALQVKFNNKNEESNFDEIKQNISLIHTNSHQLLQKIQKIELDKTSTSKKKPLKITIVQQ